MPTEMNDSQREEIARLLKQWIKLGIIETRPSDNGNDVYRVVHETVSAVEALEMASRLREYAKFDQVKSLCFARGIVDGVQQYYGAIGKLGDPSKYEKPLIIGRKLISFLEDKIKKSF